MPVPVLVAAVLALPGLALLPVGVLGWRRRLPRNPLVGVRTPASLRSEAAFRAANRVAGPPLVAAGCCCLLGGGLCSGVTGGTLAVLASVSGAGALLLVLTGGVLGDRAAAAVHPGQACVSCPATGCPANG